MCAPICLRRHRAALWGSLPSMSIPWPGCGARLPTGAVRGEGGNAVSLCIDHFGEGYMTADEAIRLGRALEPYDLAWIEDPVAFHDIAGHKLVADALQVPVAGGEDLY